MNRISRCSYSVQRSWAANLCLCSGPLCLRLAGACCKKSPENPHASPWMSGLGVCVRVKIWSGASRRLKKLPVLPSRRLAVEKSTAKAAIHSSDRRICNCAEAGCTETELPPTRPLLQQTRPTRADAREACACQRHLRRRRCAKSAARAPRYAHARCADATDAVATARAPRWRARAATPSSSRPTTV